jgi:hypothetical protein
MPKAKRSALGFVMLGKANSYLILYLCGSQDAMTVEDNKWPLA